MSVEILITKSHVSVSIVNFGTPVLATEQSNFENEAVYDESLLGLVPRLLFLKLLLKKILVTR